MASRKILVQLDIAAASNLTSPLSGFVGFSAKADGLYQKIGTAPELRLLTSADVQNAILADGSITGAVSQAQIFTMGVKLYNLTQGYIPYASGATKLLSNSPIYTNGTNVGIGTTNPQDILHVANSGGANLILSATDFGTNPSVRRIGGIKFLSDPNVSNTYYSGIEAYRTGNGYADQTDLRFLTQNSVAGSPTERMRIDNNGNVGIGTTDPGVYKLNVNGNTNITGNLNLSSLIASKVVFTNASKNLTSTGIGTAAQFIKGDGSLDSNTYITSGSISGFVPYEGATQNVNIGTFGLHSGDVSIDNALTVGKLNTGYSDGGLFRIISPDTNYSQFYFYSIDTYDEFGVVEIIANPEEGIMLSARSNDNSMNSSLRIGAWDLGLYTNSLKRLEIAQSGSINAFGNTITSTGGFIGNASTATKLQTARTITIGNQSLSFDGTQNLTYSLSGIGIPVGTASQYLRGDLSLATFPTMITGSGVDGRITFWNGTNSLSSTSELVWNNTSKNLSVTGGVLANNFSSNSMSTNTLFTQTFKLGTYATAGYVLTTDANGNGTWQAPTGGGSYTLPTATASVLGGVKIGSGITISSGTISIVSSIYNQYASAQTANAWINGYIRLGENLVLSTNNKSLTGYLTNGTEHQIIGFNSSNKISVDNDGYGSVFGGTITAKSNIYINGASTDTLGSALHIYDRYSNTLQEVISIGYYYDYVCINRLGYDRTSVMIGAISAPSDLYVTGRTKTNNLVISQSPTLGYYLRCSDVGGEATWSQIPVYKGTWNAATNTPTLSNTGSAGRYYLCTTAGTFNSVYYNVGDNVYYNGDKWVKISG